VEKELQAQIKEAKENNNKRKLKELENKHRRFHKSGTREWAEAIIFAVFAAAFIRMFLIEAYVIPTSSMEGSLMVGDFFVCEQSQLRDSYASDHCHASFAAQSRTTSGWRILPGKASVEVSSP
jgi:hypothetical protein